MFNRRPIGVSYYTPTIHTHHLESRVRVHFLTYTAILTAVHGNKTSVHDNETAVHGNKTAVYGIVPELTDCPSRPPYKRVTPSTDPKNCTRHFPDRSEAVHGISRTGQKPYKALLFAHVSYFIHSYIDSFLIIITLLLKFGHTLGRIFHAFIDI